MPQNTVQKNTFLNIFMSIVAWLAFLLLVVVVFIGDEIVQEVAIIYPDWSFAAFFIPWFLLIISSVQKLRDNKANMRLRLRIWILKTTLPVFIFIAPFLSTFSATSQVLLGLEVYCLYLAILVLFLVHFLPSLNRQQH